MSIPAYLATVQTPAIPASMAVAPIGADISVSTLARWPEPVVPTTPILAVGERFLDAAGAPWLSLPIVDNGKPVGSVSRYELMQRSLQSAFEHYARAKAAPTLLRRHAVEAPQFELMSLSARLLDYWRRIRDNARARKSA